MLIDFIVRALQLKGVDLLPSPDSHPPDVVPLYGGQEAQLQRTDPEVPRDAEEIRWHRNQGIMAPVVDITRLQ